MINLKPAMDNVLGRTLLSFCLQHAILGLVYWVNRSSSSEFFVVYCFRDPMLVLLIVASETFSMHFFALRRSSNV